MVWGAAVAAVLIWRPLHDGIMRYGLVVALLVGWIGLLVFAWSSKKGRIAAMALPLILALPFVLPARNLDQGKLRQDYLDGMRSYGGTTYLWGGESGRGIDCSGLPRRALRNALRNQALTGNGTAARLWMEHWWFDTSAKAMKEHYRDFTRSTGVSGRMTKLDLPKIEAGDLAVTDNGRHVMIYLGDQAWIQADPGAGKVIVATPGRDDNPWFDSQVSLHRWAELSETTAKN